MKRTIDNEAGLSFWEFAISFQMLWYLSITRLLAMGLLFWGVHCFPCPEGIVHQQSLEAPASTFLPASHFDGMTSVFREKHIF